MSNYAAIRAEELESIKVCRKTLSTLNKLTPRNFDQLVMEMANIDLATPRLSTEFVDLVYKKACLEPNYAELYARLLDSVSRVYYRENGTLGEKKLGCQLRRLVVSRCQEKFEEQMKYKTQYELDRETIVKSQDNSEQRKRELLLLDMKMRKFRKVFLGNIKFIGELFKLDFLAGKTIHTCIEELLKSGDCISLETCCVLLETVGSKLDPQMTDYRMNHYFELIQKIFECRPSSSRVKFLLLDVIELRQSHWMPRKKTSPITIDELRQQMHEDDRLIKEKAALLKRNQHLSGK